MDISFLIISLASLTVFGGIGFFAKSYAQLYRQSFLKATDADILRLAAKLGRINSKIVAKHTALSKTEASIRIQHLSVQGALKTLYDNWGYTSYCLKNNVDLEHEVFGSPTFPTHEISKEEVISIAKATANHFSAAHLCLAKDVSLKEAKRQLSALKKQGIIEGRYTDDFMEKYYSLSAEYQPLLHENKTYHTKLKPQVVPQKLNDEMPSKATTDASVIQEAIKREGKLSVASLCVGLNLEVDEAKRVLERLHEKEVFEIKVSENGAIEYWLLDRGLL